MMQRMLAFLSARIAGVHQAAYVLAGFAFLSAILAFLRDRLLAHTFGAGIELDIYYAAFRIPDIIFVVIASLVSVYALIPALSARDRDQQRAYIDTIFAGFSLLAAAVSAVLFVFADSILALLFPKLVEAGHLAQLVLLTRIMLIQPILLGFSNILAAITQMRSRYVLYASTSLLYNLGIIVGIAVFYPLFGLAGLAWGVVFGALLHAGVQLPHVMQAGFLCSLPRFRSWSALRETAAISLPRALALSMNQITIFALVILAGTMTAGSISVFNFALNLQAVPLAIIGASYSVAAFPTLARAFSNGEREQFVMHVSAAARHILFWTLPAVVLVIVLRAHIVRVVLGTGAFDWTDTRLTAAALALFILSLVAHALMLLLVRAFYAAGRSWVPLWVAAAALSVTTLLGTLFALLQPGLGGRTFLEILLRVEGVPGAEVLLLPFAYTLGLFVAIVLLVILFQRRFGGFIGRVARVFWEGITAAGIAGGVAYATLAFFGGLQEATTFVTVLVHGTVAGTLGVCAGALFYWLAGSSEFAEVLAAFHRRWTAKPAHSGEEEI